MFKHRALGLTLAVFATTVLGCASLSVMEPGVGEPSADDPGSPGVTSSRSTVSTGSARDPFDGGFQIWDMHGSGMRPQDSVRILDPSLAEQGYWLSSSFLAMPKPNPEHRIGVGVTLDQADLDKQAMAFEKRILESGISGFEGMVMLDAEAFQPWESAKALAWYTNAARIADRHFANWYWYFQPHRMGKAVPKVFADRAAYIDWYTRQEFMQRAKALSVTVYHGRDEDAENSRMAKARATKDQNLELTAEVSNRMGKPLIVTTRADTVAMGRGKKLSRESLEASWGAFASNPDVDGIAVWNGQPKNQIAADKRWARDLMNPVLRKVKRTGDARMRSADRPATRD